MRNSEDSGQEHYLCNLHLLQSEDPHTSGSLSDRNKSGLHKCDWKREGNWKEHTEETCTCNCLQHCCDIASDIDSGQEHYLCNLHVLQSDDYYSGGKTSWKIIQDSETLPPAADRDFPSERSGEDSVLRRLVWKVWRFILQIPYTITGMFLWMVWRFILQVLYIMTGMFLWRMLSRSSHTDSDGLSRDPSRSVTRPKNCVRTPGAVQAVLGAVPDHKPASVIEENYGGLQSKSSIEMNLRQKHLEYLLGAFTVSKQSMKLLPSKPSSPPWLWRSLEDTEENLTGAETPFLSQETRAKLEFNIKNKIVQRLLGLPAVVQHSLDTFIPEAPELKVSKALPKPQCDVQVMTCDAPLLTVEQKCKLMSCVSQKQDLKTQGYPEIVMESLEPFDMPASMAEELRQRDMTDQAKDTTDQAKDTTESTPAKHKKERRRSLLSQLKRHLKKQPQKEWHPSQHLTVYYSFSRLFKHDFDGFVLFFKTLHTISTTTHPISKTPQILCKMKHSCKNYTLIYQNHILLPYVTHTMHMT